MSGEQYFVTNERKHEESLTVIGVQVRKSFSLVCFIL